jgi:hypothetical protein
MQPFCYSRTAFAVTSSATRAAVLCPLLLLPSTAVVSTILFPSLLLFSRCAGAPPSSAVKLTFAPRSSVSTSAIRSIVCSSRTSSAPASFRSRILHTTKSMITAVALLISSPQTRCLCLEPSHFVYSFVLPVSPSNPVFSTIVMPYLVDSMPLRIAAAAFGY